MLVECQEVYPVSTATILVVGPARPFREVIGLVLQCQGYTVIASCESLGQIVSGPDLRSPPDVFVVGGYESEHSAELATSIRQLRSRIPAAKWIVLGPSADLTLLKEAFEAGADGLLFDDSPPEVIQLLTSLVLLGNSFIPTSMARILSEHSAQASRGKVPDPNALLCLDDEGAELKAHVDPLRFNSPSNRPSGVTATPEGPVQFDLSGREREILHLLLQGASNKHIAEMFDLTVEKVKTHLKALFRKMKVSNRSQAAIKALRYPSLPLWPSLDRRQAQEPWPGVSGESLERHAVCRGTVTR